jgi:hypothetical protein
VIVNLNLQVLGDSMKRSVLAFLVVSCGMSLVVFAAKPPAEDVDNHSVLSKIEAEKDRVEKALIKETEDIARRIRIFERKVFQSSRKIEKDSAEQLVKIKAKHKEFKGKVQELSASTGDAWEQVREGAVKAWGELESALYKDKSRFEKN